MILPTFFFEGKHYQSLYSLSQRLFAAERHYLLLNSIYSFVSPSAFSRGAFVSYWRKYVHEVLVNRLGGLSLPRKSVVRLTDRPDMTIDVYRGRKTTIQPQQSFEHASLTVHTRK